MDDLIGKSISTRHSPAKRLSLKGFLGLILYHIVHLIFLGYPSEILARLWLAHDIAHCSTDVWGENPGSHLAWRTFDNSMRESYRTIATLVRSSLALLQKQPFTQIR
jgi:hypothetical protein